MIGAGPASATTDHNPAHGDGWVPSDEGTAHGTRVAATRTAIASNPPYDDVSTTVYKSSERTVARGLRGIDPDLRRRQVESCATCPPASPSVLFLFVAVIVAFDMGYAIIGSPPRSTVHLQAPPGAYMLVVGFVILRRMVPDRGRRAVRLRVSW